MLSHFVTYIILLCIPILKSGAGDTAEILMQEYQVVKLQTSLYFANCENVKMQLENLLENDCDKESLAKGASCKQRENSVSSKAPIPVKYDPFVVEDRVVNFNNSSQPVLAPELKYLILDFSAVYYVDSDGVKMLKELIQDLGSKVSVSICQFQGSHFMTS